jgi:predicted N-formylglutamate amidohydrolase
LVARTVYLLITCEHGGNRIPARYQPLFAGRGALLASHRGYDPGALSMARDLAHHFRAPLVHATVSRLLVDLNRSIGHRGLYSEATRALARAERARILARHYAPYRDEVEALVARAVAAGRRVVHVSSHSFTPVLDGCVRQADIGLLYDPERRGERALCAAWSALLAAEIAPLRVRRNYPYQGRNDGLTLRLRRRFPAAHYVGVELEINQKHVSAGQRFAEQRFPLRIRRAVIASLRRTLAIGC